MTTRQLFITINQIYLNKLLLKSSFEDHHLIISSHDNYYEVSHHKSNSSHIKFKIEVEHSPITYSKYYLHYRFSNHENKIAQSNTLTSKDQIPLLIKNLLIPIIREMKIDNIIDK